MTPMETLLIALLAAVVAIFGTIWTMSGKFVSRRECVRLHDAADTAVQRIDKQLNLLFSMVRALVVHSGIPEDKKEQILNGRSID